LKDLVPISFEHRFIPRHDPFIIVVLFNDAFTHSDYDVVMQYFISASNIRDNGINAIFIEFPNTANTIEAIQSDTAEKTLRKRLHQPTLLVRRAYVKLLGFRAATRSLGSSATQFRKPNAILKSFEEMSYIIKSIKHEY
jgi:hypothetical protein